MRRLAATFVLIALFGGLLQVLAFAVLAEDDAGVKRPEPSDVYKPQPSQYDGQAPRDITIATERGAKVVRVPIEGTIDLGIAAFLRRALEDHQDAAAIILDINTLGGRVDAAIQMRDALLETSVKTVAFVHPRAISAGALISLACDIIAVSPGASIGAATPIQLGEGGAEPVEEKMVSYFRTEMRTTAQAKKRRGDVAEAMVDASVQIDGLVQAGKLLTLDTEGALKWNIADLEARTFADLTDALGLEAPAVLALSENWAERLVRFLTDPVVSGLLMSLGTLGILIELYTPGIGIPGALGVLCLVLFFGGHLLVSLAGLEEILLFVVGLGLLAAEFFLIPGFGVAGIAGLVCLFAALMLTLIGLPLDVTLETGAWVDPFARVSWALLATVALMLVALRYLPRTRAGRGLVLAQATTRSDGFMSAPDYASRLGSVGVADSDLRPAGIGKFGSERVDVVSEGGYVARGAKIRVVDVEGMRVVVRAIEDDARDG